jgi:hypothetical protein
MVASGDEVLDDEVRVQGLLSTCRLVVLWYTPCVNIDFLGSAAEPIGGLLLNSGFGNLCARHCRQYIVARRTV